MGFKSSFILISNPATAVPEPELLQALGFGNYAYAQDTTLEDCIYPCDKSISIGRYNDTLIICEDYLLTTKLETSKAPQALADYEKTLTSLFPGSEVLTVACHSGVNYHLYALAKDGQRLRFILISSETPVVEWGDRLEEETAIYSQSKLVDDALLFKSTWKEESLYEYTEDQMMEDFAFGVAKRHLGVMISHAEDEELMFETQFRKYTKSLRQARPTSVKEAGPNLEDAEPDIPTSKTVRPKPWWKIW